MRISISISRMCPASVKGLEGASLRYSTAYFFCGDAGGTRRSLTKLCVLSCVLPKHDSKNSLVGIVKKGVTIVFVLVHGLRRAFITEVTDLRIYSGGHGKKGVKQEYLPLAFIFAASWHLFLTRGVSPLSQARRPIKRHLGSVVGFKRTPGGHNRFAGTILLSSSFDCEVHPWNVALLQGAGLDLRFVVLYIALLSPPPPPPLFPLFLNRPSCEMMFRFLIDALQVRKIVMGCPQVLLKSVNDNFLPKIEYFEKVVGMDRKVVASMLSVHPQVIFAHHAYSRDDVTYMCARQGGGGLGCRPLE